MARRIHNLRRLLILRWVLPLLLVTGCDAFSSTPTYGGLSVAGFNYTQYNFDRFVIRDAFGNKAGGGVGAGSLSCCYKLKGTDFTVEWAVYDGDEAIKAIDAKKKIQLIHKTTRVHLAPTKLAGGVGERVLGLHFYPDDHVEFEFRNDLRGTRIEYADVWDWLRKRHTKLIDPAGEDDSVVFRRTRRLAATGWVKYRFTDTVDLQQYVYLTLLNPQFDAHPTIQKILAETRGTPGAFGAAIEQLPSVVIKDLKRTKARDSQKGVPHG